MSAFVLALCHDGAERALKREAAAHDFRPAFQRAGLVTFKTERVLPPDFQLPVALARFSAPSLGASTLEAAERLATTERAVFHRHDLEGPSDAVQAVPRSGQAVFTLITAGSDKGWLTRHVHGPSRTPFPANRPPLVLPADAPSRAWLKIEEAIARFSLDIGAMDRVLEIGSSPGGASLALLRRGASVVGIDPNAMDPLVLAHPRFVHVRAASTQLTPDAIEGAFQWLLLDVNVPPGTALRGALPFLRAQHKSLRGAVLTLKLGNFEMVEELKGWLYRIRERLPGFAATPVSLHAHGREIVVVCQR
jgi:23S rRNA (cytidine2498-2'-O)-methyltransferase